MMSTGMSNQQIAEELYISVGTVKWHVHNILVKLDTTSRTQAVARAREYKLIV
jgi:LuxR family maltose regulon positive regulatory protein